ncbi:MAG: DUF4846 domain-containing protein [Flavobacteriales bacterium]|nr:DUF4846 domain-containing protein [Flavobacteriales bacterium]
MKKILFALMLISCGSAAVQDKVLVEETSPVKVEAFQPVNPKGKTVATRFNVPAGFTRTKEAGDSFGTYLRNLSLKPDGGVVLHYDGSEKNKSNVYVAVLDQTIGSRDLHQCADAVMRLKADYHYSLKQFDKIHFNLTNGFRMDYSEWVSGKRLKVSGNKTSWYNATSENSDAKSYWKYMEMIFSYAGTSSLSKELVAVDVADMKIGDVFIKGGFPGHAIIVIDVATNQAGEKIFMLAQSYMPAQQTQVLVNPMDADLSPWYATDFGGTLATPEWNFTRDQLMRFSY